MFLLKSAGEFCGVFLPLLAAGGWQSLAQSSRSQVSASFGTCAPLPVSVFASSLLRKTQATLDYGPLRSNRTSSLFGFILVFLGPHLNLITNNNSISK